MSLPNMRHAWNRQYTIKTELGLFLEVTIIRMDNLFFSYMESNHSFLCVNPLI